MPSFDYDLFVVGAGSGGVRAARMSSIYGAKVCIAEEYKVGGTCVVRGCVPKKLFVYASHFPEYFEDAEGYGWSVDEGAFDWPKLIRKKDAEIDRLNGIYIRNLEAAGVEIAHTRAVLKDRHTVHLVDENREFAVLRAGTGEAGKSMLARQHAIRIGEGMIGWAVANARPRVAQEAGDDAVRLATKELPETRSEAAIPLQARGQVIGAISVQSSLCIQ